MKTKYCITFAGVPGSSKSPIAQHLSWNLGLPIFNNDVLRTEIKEDFGELDVDEYARLRDTRGIALMDSGKSFIYDASVDRAWPEHSQHLYERGYEVFIISMDLSRQKIDSLYAAKGYTESDPTITIPEHDSFLEKYNDVVSLHINDDSFSDRLALSLEAAENWIEA